MIGFWFNFDLGIGFLRFDLRFDDGGLLGLSPAELMECT